MRADTGLDSPRDAGAYLVVPLAGAEECPGVVPRPLARLQQHGGGELAHARRRHALDDQLQHAPGGRRLALEELLLEAELRSTLRR